GHFFTLFHRAQMARTRGESSRQSHQSHRHHRRGERQRAGGGMLAGGCVDESRPQCAGARRNIAGEIRRGSIYADGVKRRGIQLSPRHRRWFYSISALLFLSGAAWVVFDWWPTHGESSADLLRSLKPWALKIHGAAAMAFLVAMGILIPL